ncbi:MAG: sugar ABC transporter permease [Eubacteriales bacterium]|nr:sugar ABC transporter permease [Eubacteriales bacterium]
MTNIRNKDWFWAVLFLLPSIVGLAVFTLYPLISSAYISLTDWGLLGDMNFVGFDNYIHAFKDATALTVFSNTILFTVVTVPVLLALPLLLAMALNRKMPMTRFFRATYFLPTISSMVAMSLIWQWMYNRDFGLVNYILSFAGIQGPNWLTSPFYALVAIMIVSVWKSLGYNMMLFLAGLQAIPRVYYEAADLDGCTGLRRLFRITLPLLRPTTLFITVMSIINSLQVFDQVMVITGGGPSRSSSVLVHYIYQCAFQYYEMGYGCALGWVLAIFIFLLTMTQFALNKEEYSIE